MAYRVGERAAASRLRTDFPSIAPAPGSSIAFSAAELSPTDTAGLCPEIDCLPGKIATDTLDEAEARAATIGVGADRVLIAAGVLSEEDYLRRLADTEEERIAVVDQIAAGPRRGPVIPGSGGIRKLRFGFGGHGKRGGARVIYLFGGDDIPVFLLAVFTKNEKADLTGAERVAFSKYVAKMLANYRRQR